MATDSSPLVSIITPSLNQGPFIRTTIDSVLKQTYSRVEYIVIDGGSTDNTLDILQTYGQEFQWISEKDSGQAAAVNRGMDMATGIIVGWLNSDDVLLPEAVEKVVECFQNDTRLGMVYGKSHFIDNTGKVVGRYPTEAFDFERLAMFNFIPQPSTFFTRQMFDKVGGLDPGLQYAMDLDLWIRLSIQSRVCYLPTVLSGFRLHETSKTVSASHALENQREGLDVALKYFHRAPLNRVYGWCFHLLGAWLPRPLSSFGAVRKTLTLLVTIVMYMKFNRRIYKQDIKALNTKNLRKVALPWQSIYRTY